ncbi:hypothetical protein I7648_08020 [Collinsella tanakaei]|nr:hypothetical protein [Collinsella tanakaei]
MGDALVSRLAPSRSVALAALVESERGGAYVREVLDGMPRARKLDARDRGFAMRLALGVTATTGALDELLDAYLARPQKVSARVRTALRIAAFELVYLGTAAEVAVSQGVELVRSQAKSAAGLANAVLRRVADAAAGYLAADGVDADRRPLVSMARRAGLPLWLGEALVRSLGTEDASQLAHAQLMAAPLAVQMNPRVRTTPAIGGDPCGLPGALAGVDGPRLVASGILDAADAVVSDLNAQLVATAATRPGTCLEIGAGRGTKTFMMAAQAERAGYVRDHVALDLHERKCALNRERLELAAMERIETVAGDACDLDGTLAAIDGRASERVLFDTVFVDAPCSGTGTMRRHPEIPWRLSAREALQDLPELQLELLRQASCRVQPGGELVYATCSVLEAENDAVIDAFLAGPEGSRFCVRPVSDAAIFHEEGFQGAAALIRRWESERGFFQSVPAPQAYDGHFCARLVRT